MRISTMDSHRNSVSVHGIPSNVINYNPTTTNCDRTSKRQSRNWSLILDRRKSNICALIVVLLNVLLVERCCAVSSHSVNLNTILQSNHSGGKFFQLFFSLP